MRGNDLYEFLTGEVIFDTSMEVKQNQLILGWMMLSTSANILPENADYSTAAEAWSNLQAEFTSNSRSQAINLKL